MKTAHEDMLSQEKKKTSVEVKVSLLVIVYIFPYVVFYMLY